MEDTSSWLMSGVESGVYRFNDLEERAENSNDPRGLLIYESEFRDAWRGSVSYSVSKSVDNLYELVALSPSGLKYRALVPENNFFVWHAKSVVRNRPVPLLKRINNYLRSLVI